MVSPSWRLVIMESYIAMYFVSRNDYSICPAEVGWTNKRLR